MPSLWQHKASLDSTHAFCVRVRFKLCKTQAVAQPSVSLARGASRLSVLPPLVRSPRLSNAEERRYELCARIGTTNPK